MKNEKLTIHERIRLIVDAIPGDRKNFAVQIGVDPRNLNNAYHKLVMPKANLFAQIYDKVDNINPEWWLTGEGDIWKDPSLIQKGVAPIYLLGGRNEKSTRDEVQQLKDMLKEKGERIKLLEDMMALLKKQSHISCDCEFCKALPPK